MTATSTAVLAGVVAVLSTSAWIVFLTLWLRTRGRVATLERALRRRSPGGPARTPSVRSTVGRAVRLGNRGVAHLLSSSLESLVQWATVEGERVAQVAAPDGTVTLMFSDIADSTALNEQLGDEAWVRVLAAHDRVVRREIEKQDGVVVKAIGDGFMAVFARAERAVRAASAIHAALHTSTDPLLQGDAVLLRVGVHTGTAISSGQDYLGRNVALCARLAAAADRGTSLLSGQTRCAVVDAGEWHLRAEGPLQLKGITGDVEAYTVVEPALPA